MPSAKDMLSSLTFRSGFIAADGSVTVDPDRSSGVRPENSKPDADRQGDEVEVAFRPEEELSEACDLSGHQSPIKRHRGCAGSAEFDDAGQKTLCHVHGAAAAQSHLRWSR